MSLTPYMRNMWNDLTPGSIFDQDFGMGLFNEDLWGPRQMLPWIDRSCGRCPDRPLGWMSSWTDPRSLLSEATVTKDEFRVNMDVQQFRPEEISVRVDKDRFVVIEGKHEERQDEHGFITREFRRRYLLPDDVDPKSVTSSLSSDGVLTVTAPKLQALGPNEVEIPITYTNRPALKAEQEPRRLPRKEGRMEG